MSKIKFSTAQSKIPTDLRMAPEGVYAIECGPFNLEGLALVTPFGNVTIVIEFSDKFRIESSNVSSTYLKVPKEVGFRAASWFDVKILSQVSLLNATLCC